MSASDPVGPPVGYEDDPRAKLVERLGAVVAEADAYVRTLAGAPPLARVEAALKAASEAITRVVVASTAGQMELLRAAVTALAQAEQVARDASTALNTAKRIR